MSRPARLNWRGGQATRLEALTDAVFGFAVTLLVVSLEVPDTFAGLLDMLKGFVPFAGSFAILMLVWVYHYNFFKRYDLDDRYTIFLNSALLFVVLFYVYPLKFAFTSWLGRDLESIGTWDNLRYMFAIYGGGFCAVFLVFTLLYYHAYRLRAELELEPSEIIDARQHVASCLVMIGVGLMSVANALLAPEGIMIAASGPLYMLIGLFQWRVGRHYELQRRALAAVETDQVAATPFAQQQTNP
jgi:uncharacterized membrane protein